jgi:hypothetical protein
MLHQDAVVLLEQLALRCTGLTLRELLSQQTEIVARQHKEERDRRRAAVKLRGGEQANEPASA